jgi:formate dehydrogenase subunit gamma
VTLLRLLLLAVALAFAGEALAQGQPAAPNAADERALLNYLQGDVTGRVSIPDQRAALLIQPEGRDFKEFWRGPMKWIGAVAILGMIALLAVFYTTRGRIRMSKPRSGRTLTRFNFFERFVHWLTAGSFLVLAITGLNITFGRQLLLPIIGPDAFTAWSQWAKYAHNFGGFAFMAGVVLTFLIWVAHNIPNKGDVAWLKAGGGFVGNHHPPADRFNAGQKLIFWTVVLGGVAISVTGLILMFPFAYVTTIWGMQLSQILHGVIGLVMTAIIVAHIYIGSIGMEGAFEAMGSGQVDENWAREHHSIWAAKELAKGRVTEAPAGARAAAGD